MDNSPLNLINTSKLVRDVLQAESDNIDLVVLSGDTVNPDFEDSYTTRFSEAVDELILRNIPWVSVGGEDKPGNAISRDYMIA